MPWWAVLYLIIFGILTFGAVYDDMNKNRAAFFVAGNILSGIIVVTFVVAFFNVDLASVLGPYIYAMLFVGITFEFISIHTDLKNERSLSSMQKLVVMVVVNLLVVPGYVVGLILGFRHANV